MNVTNNPYAVTPPTDKTLTKEGVAADAKAAGDALAAIPEIEYGAYTYNGAISELTIYSFNIQFNKQHSTAPKTILLSYRAYNYFWGSIHLDTNQEATKDGFSVAYIAQEIGNGKGELVVDWIAIW